MGGNLLPPFLINRRREVVEAVEKVKVTGFDPLKSNFVLALQVLAKMNEAMWESKLMVFEK